METNTLNVVNTVICEMFKSWDTFENLNFKLLHNSVPDLSTVFLGHYNV